MKVETPNPTDAPMPEARLTPVATRPIGSGHVMDTGFTGRPPRGRYSKAYMMSDIASLLDPRLWPVYVGGALVVAIPCYALFGAMAILPTSTLTAVADDSPLTPWQTPEESMARAEPRAESATVPTTTAQPAMKATRKNQVAIFAPSRLTAPGSGDTTASPNASTVATQK